MKRFFRFAFCYFLFSTVFAHAQNSESKNAKLESEEEPFMFQFEPNYETAQVQKREALLSKIKALDTLNLSEKKRLRMIKQIYKESHTNKFQKTILVNTEFEDDYYQ